MTQERPVALGFTDGLTALDELVQRCEAGHSDFAILLGFGGISRKTIRVQHGWDGSLPRWHIENHIDDTHQTLTDAGLWDESNVGIALDRCALLDMSGDPMLNIKDRGPVLGSTLTDEAQVTAAQWREQHAKERAENPLRFTLDAAPGAMRVGDSVGNEGEWEPADPSLVLEVCDIGPATVANLDIAAVGGIVREDAPAIATSIELTIEDIDDLIATLTAIKEDAIANRGFAIRASGYWTNGEE